MVGCRNFLMSGTYPTYSHVEMTNFCQQPHRIAAPTIDRLNNNASFSLAVLCLKLHLFISSTPSIPEPLTPPLPYLLLPYSRSCHCFGDTNSPEFTLLLCLSADLLLLAPHTKLSTAPSLHTKKVLSCVCCSRQQPSFPSNVMVIQFMCFFRLISRKLSFIWKNDLIEIIFCGDFINIK